MYTVYTRDGQPIDTEYHPASGVSAEHLASYIDIDTADIDAAIEQDGWCGCYATDAIDGPIVVVPAGEALTPDAISYLRQGRA